MAERQVIDQEVGRRTDDDPQASEGKYVDRKNSRTDLDWGDSKRTSMDWPSR